jgi:hypothetical protein
MPVRYRVLCGVLTAVALLVAGFLSPFGLRRSATAADPAPTKQDPAKIMGAKACVECHKPEVEAWQKSRHATKFDQLRDDNKAKDFASKMGVAQANITDKGLCVECHGQRAEATANKVISGVSCESCHGASGGENGWLNPHGSYGAKGVTREMEPPEHKSMRRENVDKIGMVRPARAYALAKNCFGCHSVPNEQLVTKTDHPSGTADFELSSYASGDVAHNLFIDPKKNALAPSLWMAEMGRTLPERKRMLYVLGQMADMEVSLRNLAGAKEDGKYSQAMAGRVKKAAGNLDDIKELVPELKPVADEFKKIKLKLKPDNKDVLLQVADKVAAAAQDVEKNHNGSKLKDLDDVIPKMGNGPRYDPSK